MKKYFFLILIILLFINTIVYGQVYYHSNSIGMVFEQIPSFRVDDFDWVIKIEKDSLLEKRTIFFKGNIHKIIEYLQKDNYIYINEYIDGDLVRSEQQKNGLTLKEEYYKDRLLINEYHYEWFDRQLQKTTYLENNEIIYEDKFILQPEGQILQVRRAYKEELYSTTGFSNTLDGSQNEWYGTETDFILFKYNLGRVILIENWNNGNLERKKTFNYTELGRTVTETILLSGETHEEKYDSNDNLISENIRNGNNVQKINYSYNEGLLIQKNIASSGVREKVLFEYNSDNNLILESTFTDNILVKEIFYTKGQKEMEKLYKGSSLLLIVTYSDNEIINEEYFK